MDDSLPDKIQTLIELGQFQGINDAGYAEAIQSAIEAEIYRVKSMITLNSVVRSLVCISAQENPEMAHLQLLQAISELQTLLGNFPLSK